MEILEQIPQDNKYYQRLYHQPVMGNVIEFIERRFPNIKEDKQWINGNCYYFASILKTRFPEGWLVYDVIDGHFLFLYSKMLIDSVHHVFLEKAFKPSEKNYIINDHMIVWDFFDKYDSLQKERIIRDCIL